jgi:hypothetical protein
MLAGVALAVGVQLCANDQCLFGQSAPAVATQHWLHLIMRAFPCCMHC